jgi:Domain of unknown function (DUF4136)
MKLQFLRIGLCCAFCGFLASCATTPQVSVRTDYNHQISFAEYKTYFLDLSEAPELRDTGRAALADSLKSALAGRGITETSRGQADLLVVPVVSTQEKLHTVPTRNTTYVLSHRGFGTGSWYMNVDVTQYTEGTLVLDFLDRRRRMVVFRGLGQGVLSTPERNAAGIRAAVERIVAALPR